MVPNAFHILEAIILPNFVLCLLPPFFTTVSCPLPHVLKIPQIHTCSFSSLRLLSAQPPCAATAFLHTAVLQILSQKPTPVHPPVPLCSHTILCSQCTWDRPRAVCNCSSVVTAGHSVWEN